MTCLGIGIYRRGVHVVRNNTGVRKLWNRSGRDWQFDNCSHVDLDHSSSIQHIRRGRESSCRLFSPEYAGRYLRKETLVSVDHCYQ